MLSEIYPIKTNICKGDFDKDDCRRILEGSPSICYHSMSTAFFKEARKSSEDANWKVAKIYTLFSNACSMVLRPDNKEDGFFIPLAGFSGCRTANLGDFSDEDVSFFSDIVPEITDIRLKARLADVVYLRSPKDSKIKIENARIAIDSYLELSLDADTWFNKNGRECWQRAVCLAKEIGDKDRIEAMKSKVFETFSSSDNLSDKRFLLELSGLLRRFDFSKEKERARVVTAKLEELAIKFKNSGDFLYAGDYCKAALEWCKLLGDKAKQNTLKELRAEICVGQAEGCASATQPDNAAAASWYEKAIQILRTIPQKERSCLINKCLTEFHKCLGDAGARSLDKMGTIVSDAIEIRVSVESIKSAMSGKIFDDALRVLVNLLPNVRVAEIQESAIKNLAKNPLLASLPIKYISRDGRTVSQTEGIDFLKQISFNNWLCLTAKRDILPALDVLRSEYKVCEDDFLLIVKQSSNVPPGREVFYAKGLFAGYNLDYVTALHLLVPQVEHMVRHHLKNVGAKTSTLDSCRIETENGLSTLVALPEMQNVFGEDVVFEIRALFCDPKGTNFRNDIAHGLVEYADCNSLNAVYTWCFILKLVLMEPFGSATKAKSKLANEDKAG